MRQSIVLLFVSCVLFLLPSVRSRTEGILRINSKLATNYVLHTNPPLDRYAVVFDAGSSGSRVHVFKFDQNLDLVQIGGELELFVQVKPGLSAYAADPKQAADSLLPLLEKAVAVVPEDMRKNTPVKLGATAGLRQLGVEPSNRILQAVRDLMKAKSSLKINDEWITILDGTQEGSYQWMTINYLLKKLGKKYSETVGVVDLGGGSVQMAYAIPEAAVKAPKVAKGEEPYVKELFLRGTKYYLYVHSYLNYGLLAARAEILGVAKDSSNPCILMTINYLLKKLGKKYSETVGVVDLGGGSVQMAYAIPEAAVKAPKVAKGEEPYVKELFLRGTKYYLYVHSYLNYGLLAARAEILGVAKDSSNPCILVGYNGIYTYVGIDYKVSAPSSGSSMKKCRKDVLKALKVDKPCTHLNCTFGGVWNGGGGNGQKNLFVASFFYDKASQAGFINASKPVAKVRPLDFKVAARRACQTTFEDAKFKYPDVQDGDVPYLCMDLVYQYTLLVDGFGLKPRQSIKLVKQIKYQNSLVEAAWPLGSAIEAVSTTK